MAKKKAEAHHGGAWKVAYADFVTAMMALFMVLWISAQDEEILLSTSQYFQSPFNSPMDNTTGVLPFESRSSPRQGGEGDQKNSVESVDLNFMNSLAREFYRLLNVLEDDPAAPVRVDVTSDGLRVTVYDRPRQPIFEEGSDRFTEWGRLVMQNLAWVVDRERFSVVVEGHTRLGYENTDPYYTEWDLSSDRANAARRALTYFAVDASRFERVSGYGSGHPLPGLAPEDESNQRITISLSLLRSRPAR
jgi:chemotaxis protein MotB